MVQSDVPSEDGFTGDLDLHTIQFLEQSHSYNIYDKACGLQWPSKSFMRILRTFLPHFWAGAHLHVYACLLRKAYCCTYHSQGS